MSDDDDKHGGSNLESCVMGRPHPVGGLPPLPIPFASFPYMPENKPVPVVVRTSVHGL